MRIGFSDFRVLEARTNGDDFETTPERPILTPTGVGGNGVCAWFDAERASGVAGNGVCTSCDIIGVDGNGVCIIACVGSGGNGVCGSGVCAPAAAKLAENFGSGVSAAALRLRLSFGGDALANISCSSKRNSSTA